MSGLSVVISACCVAALEPCTTSRTLSMSALMLFRGGLINSLPEYYVLTQEVETL